MILGNEDLTAASGEDLLDDEVGDVGGRVRVDAVFVEARFVAFEDGSLVPGGVHDGGLDGVAVGVALVEFGTEA